MFNNAIFKKFYVFFLSTERNKCGSPIAPAGSFVKETTGNLPGDSVTFKCDEHHILADGKITQTKMCQEKQVGDAFETTWEQGDSCGK